MGWSVLSRLSSDLSGDMLPMDGGGVGGVTCSQLVGTALTIEPSVLVQVLLIVSKDWAATYSLAIRLACNSMTQA